MTVAKTFPCRPPRGRRGGAPVSAILLAAFAGSFAAVTGCGEEPGGGRERIVLGIVGKSQSNPVFQAAHRGAQAAARELGPRYGLEVVVDVLTPPDEDPQQQAAAIEQLARSGVRGIAVSCSDANTLTAAIDRAVDLGATVMCFDSDAPRSRRAYFYGTADLECGRLVMRELARAMDGRGVVAVLAGNQAAPNLRERVAGVVLELAAHPEMRLLDDGVFYHPETPEQAAETVNRVQATHPEIGGWAMVGGWPLFTRAALRWEPGEPKVVAVDALPAQLPYLESGHVEVLLAQDCYGWGHRSVEVLLAKLLEDVEPEEGPVMHDPLQPVRKDEAAAFAEKWKTWMGR